MGDRKQIAFAIVPGKVPGENEIAPSHGHAGPATLIADEAPGAAGHDAALLAYATTAEQRANVLTTLQQSHGNFYVQNAVAEYQRTHAATPSVLKPHSAGLAAAVQAPASPSQPVSQFTGTSARPTAATDASGKEAYPNPSATSIRNAAPLMTAQAAAAPQSSVHPMGEGSGKGIAASPAPGAPRASIDGWKAGIHAATSRLAPAKIQATAKVADLHQAGAVRTARQQAANKELPGEGKGAISKSPKVSVDPPLIPPRVDPVPNATALVQDASNKVLASQTMPPMLESPQHNMPVIGPAPSPAPPAPADKAAIDKPAPAAPAADAKDPKKEQADKTNQDAKKEEPGAIHKGSGGEIVFEGHPATEKPEPELPGAFKQGIGAALARLMADPKAEADAILTEVRGRAFNGELARQFPDIGKSKLDGLTTSLSAELDGIRKEAGISEQEINSAVSKRKQEVEQEKLAALGQVAGAGDAEKKKLADAGTEALSIISGTREQIDLATEDKIAAAKGDNDPEAVRLKRERLIHDTQTKVGKQVVFYEEAGKTRKAEIGQVVNLQRIAYRNAVKLDEDKIAQMAGSPEAVRLMPWNLSAAASRNWGGDRQRQLEQLLVDKGRETDTFVLDRRNAVHNAGQQAVEMIRTWADGKLNEHRSFWQKIWQAFMDWGKQARAESQAWENSRNKATRDAVVNDMAFLGSVALTASDQLNQEQMDAIKTLSAERQAIIMSFYGVDRDGKPVANAKDAHNPLAAIATGLRVRILQQRAPEIHDQFLVELSTSPDSEWRKLDALGGTERQGFSAAKVCSEVYEALHGGLIGWNDEDRVFAALAGLTKVQSMAARHCYRTPKPDGYDRDLDEDIKSEMGGTFGQHKAERDRAIALLEGDQTAADVATLREAMKGGITGWGTDSKAIMATLRGKSAAERDKIKQLYFDKYGDHLEDDLKDELTGAFEDEHDYSRAQALMEGNTNKADAIAIDQAMYGASTNKQPSTGAAESAYRFFSGAGTDQKAMEDVYDQVRKDVENDLNKRRQEAEQRGEHMPELTTKELETEVKRRYDEVESSYNVTYGDRPTPTGESALRAAFKDEMQGADLALMNAVADNNHLAVDAARIQVEKESLIYADDKVVNGVLQKQYERALEELKRDEGPALQAELAKQRAADALAGHPWDVYKEKQEQHKIEVKLEERAKTLGKTYMNQLESTYNTNFGGNLRAVVDDITSGVDNKESRVLLAQGGYLTPAQQVHFSTEGLGTREEAFARALEGRTPEEMVEIRKEWAKMHPGESLEDRIDSETSGKLNFELKEKLSGEPMTREADMAHMARLVQHEDDTGSLLIAGDERERMDFRYQQMKLKYNETNDPNLTDEQRAQKVAEFQREAGYTNVSVEEHKESMESVTDGIVTAVTTAIAVTLAALAIFFSGGTAAPFVAALATWWGAGTAALATAAIGIGIRKAMLGSDYGVEQMEVDAAIGGVDAIAAAATAGLSKVAMSSAAERLAEREIAQTAAAEGKSLSKAAQQAILRKYESDPSIAKGLLETMSRSSSRGTRIFTHAASGAFFGMLGAAPSGAARSILDSKTWENGGAWGKILEGTTGGMKAGAVGGGIFGVIGGIKSPNAHASTLEQQSRPMEERDILPWGGKHTSETLSEGLPPDLQKKIPISVDPELEANTVRVHYEVDEHGAFKDIHIRAGPEATPRDIELHVKTVRTMQKYAGLQGRIRVMIAKARARLTGGTVPSARFREALMEVDKLPAVIREYEGQLADPNLEPQVREDIEAKLDGYNSQLNEHQGVLEGIVPEGEARGYVAAEGRKKQPAAAGEAEETAPAPRRGKATRAQKVADLSGKLSEAEEKIAALDTELERLRRSDHEIERRRAVDEAKGAKPNQKDMKQYAQNEKDYQKTATERDRVTASRNKAKSALDKLAGTPQERARWEEHKFEQLGSETTAPCFAPGTLVHTPRGPRRIEELCAGDEVCVWDFAVNATAHRTVARVIESTTSHLQRVSTADDAIMATRLHSFWSDTDQQWKEARKLWPGDTLLTVNERPIPVCSVEPIFLNSPTFNLEVNGIHNYFVGTGGVLVHNGVEALVEESAADVAHKFTSGVKKPSRIYLVQERIPGTQDQWRPLYVGKTVQGGEGDVETRFKQHLEKKAEWLKAKEEGRLRSVEIESGNWTEFETAVWEEHYIRQFGGLKKENGTLENARHEITSETYNEYRDGYGHNPCARK
jgi:hypothetical protein